MFSARTSSSCVRGTGSALSADPETRSVHGQPQTLHLPFGRWTAGKEEPSPQEASTQCQFWKLHPTFFKSG